jgi:hypothetical protein
MGHEEWRELFAYVGVCSFIGWILYAGQRLISLIGRRLPVRAYLIITVDTRSTQIIHAGIYSCPASQLTMGGGSECKFDGLSVEAENFEEARKDLLATIRMLSTFRWILNKMPPGELQ